MPHRRAALAIGLGGLHAGRSALKLCGRSALLERAERAEKVASDAATDGKAAGGQTKGRGKGKSGSGNKGTLSSTLEGTSKPSGSEKADATLVD